MPRRPRRHTDCRFHHITTRGNNRRSMFEDAVDRERFYALLDTGITSHHVECHQDVQMGNHVHLLLEGAMAEISKLLWFVSHRYACAYNQRHGRINHLIGRRFHASEVPDRYAARAVCVYIAMNPVRAGLCAHPSEWAYGSYGAHVTGDLPRPHLATDYTRQLFAGRGTTFEGAIAAAIALDAGGRPPLAAILPTVHRLTPEHVRHAREIYGYTVHEIAGHYGRTAQTMKRWLSDAYEPRLKRLSTSQ
jgi:REP element-mobilizing transposase RayT